MKKLRRENFLAGFCKAVKKILLIDEGTSALDKESAKSLVEMLLGNKELTIIMISHDISDELRGKFDNKIKL